MKSILTKILLLATAVFFVSNCDDVDLSGDDGMIVTGLWQLYQSEGDNTFLYIGDLSLGVTSDSVFNFYYYDASENCKTPDEFKLSRIDGDGFYFINKGGEMDEDMAYAISKVGERIHVRDIDETQRELDKFWPSEVNLETLAPDCPNEAVFGTWKLDSEDQELYLSVTEQQIMVTDFDTNGSCYFTNVISVDSIDGSIFSFSFFDENNDLVQEQAIMDVVDGVLKVTRSENGQTIEEDYLPSTIDISTLSPLCDNGF